MLEQSKAPCPLCVAPRVAIDTALLNEEPSGLIAQYGLDREAVGVDGIVARHVEHLRARLRQLDSLSAPPPPMVEVDPIAKTQWAQEVLFRMTYATSSLRGLDEDQQMELMRTQGKTLATLLAAIRLETEQRGDLARAAVKGKRAGERETAVEEAELEKLLSPEEQLAMYAATLRLHGYEVIRTAQAAADTIAGDEGGS